MFYNSQDQDEVVFAESDIYAVRQTPEAVLQGSLLSETQEDVIRYRIAKLFQQNLMEGCPQDTTAETLRKYAAQQIRLQAQVDVLMELLEHSRDARLTITNEGK